ncbi:c-type cytochrome [Ramlibacter sp. AN1015]|uniref:c-type cytochrome n=1 Tax=Ramlibacter sp. AN1015 TaxID=3133428 RepID=UPI0030C0A355
MRLHRHHPPPRRSAGPLALGCAVALAAALAGCGREEAPPPPSTMVGSGAGSGAPTDASITPAPAGTGAPVPGNVEAARAAPPAQPTAGTSANPAGSAQAGQSVFARACVACHGAGVAGAPRLGDKADWAPRIAQGMEVLYRHSIEGYKGSKGVMPPKGGVTALADADVRSAVDYMVAQAR